MRPRENPMNHLRLRRLDLLLAAVFLGLVTVAPSPTPAMESTPPSASAGRTRRGRPALKERRLNRPAAEAAAIGARTQRRLLGGLQPDLQGPRLCGRYRQAAQSRSRRSGRDCQPDRLFESQARPLRRRQVLVREALAANPKYARTWSYYGMWHAEQGNLLKAQDILEKVRSICGTECKEYTELKGVIEGTVVY